MFYAGARFVTAGHSYRTFDWSGASGLVEELTSGYGTETALAAKQ